jgi:hypothetical protein
LFSYDENFYKNVFPQKNFAEQFEKYKKGEFDDHGELDFNCLINFKNNDKIISSCTLNLLQSGFSRRSSPFPPVDYYKGNGRVRHEQVVLNMGPLLSIHVHSYQGCYYFIFNFYFYFYFPKACEIKERENPSIDHNNVGGLEHFKIYIFRNTCLIGGENCEVIEGKDIIGCQLKNPHFSGYNELARENCVENFINHNEIQTESSLLHHKLTIDLITASYLSIYKNRNGQYPFSKININKDTWENLIK